VTARPRFIVTGRRCRLRREIARLASEPGVSVARLAMKHGLNANLVFK
jgi:transposase-like protein